MADKIVITAEPDDGSDRWKALQMSFEEFEQAVNDEEHPLHDGAVEANRQLAQNLGRALAPLAAAADSHLREIKPGLAAMARAIAKNLDLKPITAPSLPSLKVGSTEGFKTERLVPIGWHDRDDDVDLVVTSVAVPDGATAGEAGQLMVARLEQLVAAAEEANDQRSRQADERRSESFQASRIATKGLAVSRVTLVATKATKKINAWMLAASIIAALTGTGALIVGILTLNATR